MLSNLLEDGLDADLEETEVNERTATFMRRKVSRSHTRNRRFLGKPVGVRRPPPHDRVFTQEIKAILALFNVERSHQAIFRRKSRLADSVSDLPSASPTRVAVDETAVKVNGEWSWVYTAIVIETKLLLDIEVFVRHGTDQAAMFLGQLAQKHNLSDTVFLVDGYGYRIALFRIGLSGQLNYTERNLIEKWFHTL